MSNLPVPWQGPPDLAGQLVSEIRRYNDENHRSNIERRSGAFWDRSTHIAVALIVAGGAIVASGRFGIGLPKFGSPANPSATIASLETGRRLMRDQSVGSPRGAYSLGITSDGALVEHDRLGRRVWTAPALGPVDELVTQTDCNLVALGDDTRPVWASGQYLQASGCVLRVQDDGNAVVSDADGTVWWDRFTSGWINAAG